MAVNLLSAAECKNAGSNGTAIRKLHDGDGLYLWVYRDGRKYWRIRYWQAGKEKSLSLGVYPKVALSDPRKKRDELRKQLHTWAPQHATAVNRHLENNIFPMLGKRPIGEIQAPELLQALRRIEARGSYDLAHRVLQVCGQVFRYGIATGRCSRNLSTDLRGALAPHKMEHQAAVRPEELPALLRAIAKYDETGDKQPALPFSCWRKHSCAQMN